MKGITVDKLRKRLYQVSEGLELIIALVAVVGVVIAAVNLFPELLVYWQNPVPEIQLPALRMPAGK